jgi:hypothetical protein
MTQNAEKIAQTIHCFGTLYGFSRFLFFSFGFCLRPVSEADAKGLGTTICPPTPFVDFFF